LISINSAEVADETITRGCFITEFNGRHRAGGRSA